jgi:urea-proton symporter
VVGFIWLSFSTIGVGIYPLWESRATIAHVSKAMWGDVTGKPPVQVQARAPEDFDSQPDVTEKAVSGKDTSASSRKVDV